MKIVAIIQARMGASRLPGKMFLNIAEKPAIQRVWERLKPTKTINEIWLATTESEMDNPLAQLAKKKHMPVFRGSEDDVLDRYYQIALLSDADVIVRITGDCPLHDFRVVDKVVREFCNGEYDYVSNSHPPTYPDGLDTEVFSFNTLKKTWRDAKLKSEREHVTAYIWKHPELFKIKNVASDEDLSNHRWTLDTNEDLKFIRLVAEECKKNKKYCGLNEIMEILKNHPEWLEINSQIQRNEGYLKSLKKD